MGHRLLALSRRRGTRRRPLRRQSSAPFSHGEFAPEFSDWGLPKFAKAVVAQRFRRSLTDLPDEKVSFFDAAILIFSPLAGLRPSRSGVALTLNFPNPGSDTSAPLAAASTMSFRKSSTIDLACTLLTPCVSESFATSSVAFIAEVPCDSIRGVYGMGPPACHCRVIGRLTRTSRNVTTAADGPWLRVAMNGGSVRFVGLFERSAPCRRAQ